jgi:hypothetical protein
MTTIKYVRDNQDMTDDGYRLSEEISRFVDEAADADYQTEEGEPLQDAVDQLNDLANGRPPDSVYYLPGENCATVREIVLTLFAPKSALPRWQVDELKEALRTLTKEQLVDALVRYGTAANELFRLKWLVAERGGWRKPRVDPEPPNG